MTAPDGEEAAGEAIIGDNTDEVLLCGVKKRSTGQWNGILTPFGGSVCLSGASAGSGLSHTPAGRMERRPCVYDACILYQH